MRALALVMTIMVGGAASAGDLIQGPQKLVCVSWFDYKTQITEQDVSEYAMASIQFTQGDWSYSADVIEGKLNSIEIQFQPLEIFTHTHSMEFPLNTLQAALRVKDRPASVECDIRQK